MRCISQLIEVANETRNRANPCGNHWCRSSAYQIHQSPETVLEPKSAGESSEDIWGNRCFMCKATQLGCEECCIRPFSLCGLAEDGANVTGSHPTGFPSCQPDPDSVARLGNIPRLQTAYPPRNALDKQNIQGETWQW